MAEIRFEPSEFMLRRLLAEENKERAAQHLPAVPWEAFLAAFQTPTEDGENTTED